MITSKKEIGILSTEVLSETLADLKIRAEASGCSIRIHDDITEIESELIIRRAGYHSLCQKLKQ